MLKKIRRIFRFLQPQYPHITYFKAGDNDYRVVTRDALGSKIEDTLTTPQEMQRVAQERFSQLGGNA